jgi:Uma2 family endonuclease
MTISAIEYQLRSTGASWCLEKWEQLPDDGNRYEVIDGVLYMSTAPSFDHQQVILALVELVGLPLRHAGIAIPAFAPVGVIMLGADPVQPDFVLVRTERRDIISAGRIRGVLDLIAEVLSPGNAEHDMVVKRGAYARAGVPEYWIVRPDTQDVLVLTEPDRALSEYAESHRFSSGMELVSPTLAVRVSVGALFQYTIGDSDQE